MRNAMHHRFYEVQIARVIDNKKTAILTTITAPIIAEDRTDAWMEFCNRRGWALYASPSHNRWVRTITEVDTARWEYLCECFDESEKRHE